MHYGPAGGDGELLGLRPCWPCDGQGGLLEGLGEVRLADQGLVLGRTGVKWRMGSLGNSRQNWFWRHPMP